METEVFVDTSGFYALLVKRDDAHVQAKKLMRKARQQKRTFVCTDYIIDETATLIKARGLGYLLNDFFDVVLHSRVCRIEWTDNDRFFATKELFLKHSDRGWSFTDCLSFVVMKELKARASLTKDKHFLEAGFDALLVRR